MTYFLALAYLYGLQKHGIKLGLETIAMLTQRLGLPQDRYRILHVAGTNGKGSTAALLASILQAAGYRVGLYTSPHLVEFRERIRVNNEMITESQVAQLTEHLQAVCHPDLTPTFFEYTTAMALQHFADSAVEVAVIEVGLGGRFDATNIVTPCASVITTIALDHQEHLGSTLAAIAFEKAGIVKTEVPVVLGRIEDAAWRVIESVTREQRASVVRLNRNFSIQGETPQQFSYRGIDVGYDQLTCPLLGRHQLDNIACALALLEVTALRGITATAQAVRDGLAAVEWAGRLEVIHGHPTILLDGAHNPAAALVLADYLTSMLSGADYRRVILVLGMMRDKDHRGFVTPLRGLVDEVVLTQVDLPRSATAQELQSLLGGLLSHTHMSASLAAAMLKAKALAGIDGLVCVTGSLMLVGECKSLLLHHKLSPLRG